MFQLILFGDYSKANEPSPCFSLVQNAINPIDYAGGFYDISGNLGIGLDYCSWGSGVSAISIGLSTTPGAGGRVDWYMLVRSDNGYDLYQYKYNGDIDYEP